MTTTEHRHAADGIRLAGTGAWTALAAAALDVLFGVLWGRSIAGDPMALALAFSAMTLAAAVVWGAAALFLRMRRRHAVGGAASCGVLAFCVALFAIAAPPSGADAGWPAARILFGVTMALAVGVAASAQRPLWPRAPMALHGLGVLIWAMAIAGPWIVQTQHRQPPPFDAASVAGPRHVYLIVVDTLRGDAVSYDGARTPHLDALAVDSVVFRNAMSQAPWTIPAMTSMLTGQSPLVHWCIHRWSRVPRSIPTLAERMREAGYNTAVVGRNPVLGEATGIHRGFDRYAWHPRPGGGGAFGNLLLSYRDPLRFSWSGELAEATTTHLIDEALAVTAAAHEAPLFLWLHIFDPHLPYSPPAPYLGDAQPPSDRFGYAVGFDDFEAIRAGIVAPNAEERAWIRALYDAEVRYVDAEIGRFISHLKNAGLYDDALIVVASDHGEEFWEHGAFEHGHSLFRELLHVPLLVKLPRQEFAQASDAMVSTTAIAPTILDLCGIPFEPASLSAQSLRTQWSGTERNETPHYATGLLYFRDREAVIADGLKYIYTFDGGWKELYDLRADPEEWRNIAPENPDAIDAAWRVIDALRKQADAIRAVNEIDDAEAPPAGLDPAQRNALESVGYL